MYSRYAQFFPGLIFLLALLAWSGCGDDADPGGPSRVPDTGSARDHSLLALGDSYTVGHSLPSAWSWPFQLADSLAAAGDTLETLRVIARTGWTTRDLLDAVQDSLAGVDPGNDPYGVVTLMIGVNNQFQGLAPAVFESELDTLITLALERTEGDPARVLGFSIPDYGVTPAGELFGADRIAAEIDAYNVILERKFGERGLAVVDVTTLSRLAGAEPDLVAKDGLHYSRAMYARWVSLMLPRVRSCLDPSKAVTPGQ